MAVAAICANILALLLKITDCALFLCIFFVSKHKKTNNFSFGVLLDFAIMSWFFIHNSRFWIEIALIERLWGEVCSL